MNRSGDRDDFGEWLDRELGRVVAVERRSPPPPAYRTIGRPRGAGRIARTALAGALVSLVVAGGAGGVAMATGGNPVTWGAHVVTAVSSCADSGSCVGALTTQRPAPSPSQTARGGGEPDGPAATSADAQGGSHGNGGDHQAGAANGQSDQGSEGNGQGQAHQQTAQDQQDNLAAGGRSHQSHPSPSGQASHSR